MKSLRFPVTASKRAVILISTWMLSVAVVAAAQIIAEENPPQNSPDLTAVEKAIKEKLESSGSNKRQAHPEPRSPSKSKKSGEK